METPAPVENNELAAVETNSSDMQPISSETQPGNTEMHPVSSEMNPVSSEMHPDSSEMHAVDSEMHPIDSEMQPVGSEMHPVGSEMQLVGSEMQPVGSEMQPVGSEMQPVGSEMHPVGSEMQAVVPEMHPGSAAMQSGGSEMDPVGSEMHPVGSMETPAPVMHPGAAEMHPVGSEMHPVGSMETPAPVENNELAPVETNSSEIPPISSETQPVDTEMHHISSEMHHPGSEMHHASSEMHHADMVMHHTGTEMHHADTEMQHASSEMHTVGSEMHHVSSEMHHVSSEMQPVSSQMHLVSSQMHPVNVEMQLVSSEMHPVSSDLHPVSSDMQLVSSEMQEMEPIVSDMHPIDPDVHSNNFAREPNIFETPPSNPETQPGKRRKKKSIVWEHFTIENVGAGCRRACCKQCKQSFAYSTGSKVAGTSHLKRHIAKGTCPVVLRNQEKNQLSPYSAPSKTIGYSDTPKRRYRTAAVPYFAFDADRCRHEIARMIILHDYPLHMVEHPGFVAFVQNLQPRFDMVSFNTVQGDCVATYLREKQNLQKLIEGIPGRISLTLDLWSSCRTTGYMFVTGQFIDSDWKMHRKLLNVVIEPCPDSDTAFSHSVAACLSDWNMEGKLFSVTINQPLSDASIDNLRALLSVKNPLVLNGQLLVENCLARTLSSIAEDAFKSLHGIVKKIRDSVKYVKTSETREEKFLELKRQLQVPSSKTLAIDDQTQWNTTYEMLLAASELKEVFSCLDTSDPDYKNAPSMEDWKRIETLCMFLKPLFDTAYLLTSSTTPTTNTFFHEAWKIQLELARASSSEDPFISGLTKSMQEKFGQYWKSCCFILAIAVVMDPRFKMKLVEFSFSKIYGEEVAAYVKTVDEGIHELFFEYVALPLPLTPAYVEEANGGSLKQEDTHGIGISSNGLGLTDFDMYIMETTSQQSKSELDQYLEESLLPRVHEFDVIGWWKLNRLKYPTLSKMARDILSLPVSTVPTSSVFDTVRKEMDSYRCSLRPETVEALICAKDWLQSDTVQTSSALVKMEVPI